MYTIHIPNWRPHSTNQLTGVHWATKHRRKKRDREVVAIAAIQSGVPRATGKRSVKLLVTLGKGKKGLDADNYWKSCLDALVECGQLLDDRKETAELLGVEFERGEGDAVTVILEDLG